MAEEEEPTAATRADVLRPRSRRDSAAPGAPKRLGHFQVLEPLGRGGMGTVYSAYDLRLDRKVALKLLNPDNPDDPEGPEPERDHHRNQRLLREAQAMAKLSHPNVVPVYEVGVDGGTVFVAMEYIPGATLSAWLKRDKPSWRAIVAVFVQAARGLAAAHDAGIVHRDFKPANVLVDDTGSVRVVDFGIAQVRGVAAPDLPVRAAVATVLAPGDELTPPSAQLTELGSLVGTPAYMSPEQHKAATVDARSDQFSFCVALYEALFGKRPFVGRGADLVRAMTDGAIAKPDPRTPVPGWVTAIVTRGLAADPEARWPSMTALADALARDPARGRRRIATAALGVAAIGASVAAIATHVAQRDDTCGGADAHLAGAWDPTVRAAIQHGFEATHLPYAAPSAARVQTVLDGYARGWVAAHTDACRATRVRGEQSAHVLDLRMACLDRRLGELRALTTVLAGAPDAGTVEHAVDAAGALTPVAECADTAGLLGQAATISATPAGRARHAALEERLDALIAARRLGRFTASVAPAAALVADARAGGDVAVLAAALQIHGEIQLGGGDAEAAQATLGDALRQARALGDPDRLVTVTLDVIDVLAATGISHSREALGAVRLAEAFVADAHDPALAIRVEYTKGSLDLSIAHADEALPILEQAYADARRVLGDTHALTLRIGTRYAAGLRYSGKPTEARPLLDQLVASATATFGATHPSTLTVSFQRCDVIAQLDAAAGVPCYAALIPQAMEVLGATNRELLGYRCDYGGVLVAAGKRDEALAVFAAAYADLAPEMFTEKWFVATDITRALGSLEVDRGDFAAALPHCQQADAATEHEHDGQLAASCVGQALLGAGRTDEALAALEPLVQLADQTPMDRRFVEPDQVGQWRFAYARALWLVKHQAGPARAAARQARAELEAPADQAEVDAWLATLPR